MELRSGELRALIISLLGLDTVLRFDPANHAADARGFQSQH